MKRRKFSHRSHQLLDSALAPPDNSTGLPFTSAMTITSAPKFYRQSEIYTGAPSNVKAPLTVKGKYIGPGVFDGALLEGLAYSFDVNMLYISVVDRRGKFIMVSEAHFIRSQD